MFTCINKDLADAVSWVAQGLSTRVGAAGYNTIRVKVSADDLTRAHVYTANQDVSSTTTFPVSDVVEPVDFLVGGPALVNYVRIAPPHDATVFSRIDGDDSRVRVKSGRFMTRLPVLPASLAPSFPEYPEYDGVVDGKVFAQAARRVVPCAAPEKTSIPVFSGVLIVRKPEERTLTFVATDRYRLGVTTLPYTPVEFPSDNKPLQVVLPAKFASSYAKAFHNEPEVQFGVGADDQGNSGVFVMSDGHRTVTGRLLGGDFAQWEPIVTKVSSSKDLNVVLPTDDVIAAMRRVSAMSDQNAPVELSFHDNSMDITSVMDGTTQTTDSVPVDYAGDQVTVKYSGEYLLDGFIAADGPVTYATAVARDGEGNIDSSRHAAGILQTVNSDENSNFTYIIMPLSA